MQPPGFNGSPASRQRAFAPGHQARYPASYAASPAGGPGMTALVSCCLSAAGPRFLGHPVPPGDSAPLTIGLPHRQQAARTRAGFPCSARVRPGRLRVPSVPRGRRCPHDRSSSRPPPAASQRPAPGAPDCDPPRDVLLTRHQQGFTVIHPTPAFPSPVTPDGTGSSGFSLSFAPSRAGPGNARQGGDRPGHCLDYVPGISQPPSTYSLTTCDLMSQRTGNLRAVQPHNRLIADRAKSAIRTLVLPKLVALRGDR